MTATDPDKVADAVTHAMMVNDRASGGQGIRLVQASPGDVLVEMTVTEHQINGHDSCHGGVLFTLADTAFGLCCNSHGPPTVAYACDIVFVRPGRIGDVLRAHCTERSRAGRNGIYDVTVTRAADGEVVAEFRGRSRTIGTTQPGSDGIRIAEGGERSAGFA